MKAKWTYSIPKQIHATLPSYLLYDTMQPSSFNRHKTVSAMCQKVSLNYRLLLRISFAAQLAVIILHLHTKLF